VCDPTAEPPYTWPVSDEWIRVSQLRRHEAYLDGSEYSSLRPTCVVEEHKVLRMLHKHTWVGPAGEVAVAWVRAGEAQGFA
jgi:hypothetical protein